MDLEIGSVVQVSPSLSDSFFPACFMTVTEVRHWGVQGYVMVPESRTVSPSVAYYRALWEDIELVGRSAWMAQTSEPADYTDNIA